MSITAPERSATSLSPDAGGPDFLCIGQSKAGTGWLYDMLQFDPDFWMPPLKELKFFNNRFPVKRVDFLHDKMPKKLEKADSRREQSRRRPFDERDARFVEHAITYRKYELSLDWYKKLFAPKAALVSGDITPAYAILDSKLIATIAEALPDLRLVLLLRDPVARTWSNFNMQRRKELTGLSRGVDQPSADLVAAFQQKTSTKELVKYLKTDRVKYGAFPSSIYQKWGRHFELSQICVIFFEDIIERPEDVIRKFREDLGLPGGPAGDNRLAADFNRKAGRLKQEMPDDARAILVDTFRDEMRRCAELFGGAAQDWPRHNGIT